MDGTTQNAGSPGSPRSTAVLAVMVLSLLVVVLDNSILNVALRRLADRRTGLGASQGQLEWSINSYTLVFASLLFAWSFAAERFGRKRALLAGLAVFGAASVASAYARDPGQLIAARAVMGLGAAAVQPVSLSIVTAVTPPANRAKAIGVWSSAAGAGVALGPLLGGILLEHFWWGSVFLVNVPIVAVALAATAVLVPDAPGHAGVRLDVPGVVLSAGGMLALTYGVIHGGELGGWSSPAAWLPLAGGLGTLAVFAFVELRAEAPILDVRMFANRRFTGAAVAVVVSFFGLMGVFFALLFYLQSVRGFSPLQAAACVMPIAVAQLLVSPRAGLIIRRMGHRRAAVAGLAVAACCVAMYARLDAGTPVWALEAVMFVHGVSLSFVIPPVTALMMGAVPPDRPAAGAAANTAVRQAGTALGVAVLGALLSARYRTLVAPHLGALPVAVRSAAAESIEKTLAAAGTAPGVAHGARHAFVGATHTTVLVAAAVTALGALAVAALLPRTAGPPPGPRAAAPRPDPLAAPEQASSAPI